MNTQKIYLDFNATTPLHPEIKTSVINALENSGNPSSVHWAGRQAKRLISNSRETFAQFVGCEPLEVIWTAGGSEANNLALKGLAYSYPDKKHAIISTVEHPSIKKTAEFLEKFLGFKVDRVGPDKSGTFDLEKFKSLLRKDTLFVSVQLANNETGNIFPLKEIARLSHEVGAFVHSDMVQALGKISINVKDMGVDLASFAGHKFYTLKGVGALVARRGIKLESLIHGGGQERSRRAGTENLMAIHSLGEAVRTLGPRLESEAARLGALRNTLQQKILTQFPFAFVTGHEMPRLPNTLNVTFPGYDGETMLINLDTRGFAISSGAACSSGSQEPSPVLTAMGLSRPEAQSSLRISLGLLTTSEEVELFFNALTEVINQMTEAQNSGQSAASVS